MVLLSSTKLLQRVSFSSRVERPLTRGSRCRRRPRDQLCPQVQWV